MKGRIATALLALALGCDPSTSGAPVLEVYLRSDLSAAERAGVTLAIHVRGGEATEDASDPIRLAAGGLVEDDLASAGGAFLGRWDDVPPDRYDVAIDFEREGGDPVRADVAAVDFRGTGAQQVVFLVLRGGPLACDAETPCPEAPCATAECIGGSCFVLRASDWTESCECDGDADCPGASGCGASRCTAHACRAVPDDTRCGPTESCGADLECDPVTCRGRAAGEVCRGASGACDAPETCPTAGGDCPADAALDVGAACIDDDSGLPGFCTARPDVPDRLVCDTRCEAGRPCQVGCLAGVQVCLPTPSCDTSGGGSVPDGTSCGVAVLCRAAPSCTGGVCEPGDALVGETCGPDPMDDCVAAPRCDAAGSCEPTLVPTGTPCRGAGAALVCYGFACSAAGVCLPTPVTTDSRCDGSMLAVYDACGVQSCSHERVTSRWGCNPQPADDACITDVCDVETHCELQTTMAFGTRYVCSDYGAWMCRRSDGTTAACSWEGPYDDCDLNSRCVDGVRDGGEGDVDCGGGCWVLCGPGQTCDDPLDCDSATCTGGICE